MRLPNARSRVALSILAGILSFVSLASIPGSATNTLGQGPPPVSFTLTPTSGLPGTTVQVIGNGAPRWLLLNKGPEAVGGADAGMAAPSRVMRVVSSRDALPGGRQGFPKSPPAAPVASLMRLVPPSFRPP